MNQTTAECAEPLPAIQRWPLAALASGTISLCLLCLQFLLNNLQELLKTHLLKITLPSGLIFCQRLQIYRITVSFPSCFFDKPTWVFAVLSVKHFVTTCFKRFCIKVLNYEYIILVFSFHLLWFILFLLLLIHTRISEVTELGRFHIFCVTMMSSCYSSCNSIYFGWSFVKCFFWQK